MVGLWKKKYIIYTLELLRHSARALVCLVTWQAQHNHKLYTTDDDYFLCVRISHSSIIYIVLTSVVYFIEDDQCWPWGETTRCRNLITPGVMSHGSQIQEGVSSRTKRGEIQEPVTRWVCTCLFSNISIYPRKYLLISKAWSLVMVVLQKWKKLYLWSIFCHCVFPCVTTWLG